MWIMVTTGRVITMTNKQQPEGEVSYRCLRPLGFPGYRVGDDGSVWTCKRRIAFASAPGPKFANDGPWKRRAASKTNNGYLIISLAGPNGAKALSVHSLVMRAFVGPPPEGKQVAHENGIRTDNRLVNLSYKTASENQQDRFRHGTDDSGEKHKLSVLTEEKVKAIRQEYAAGGSSYNNLAIKYGVSKKLILNIIKRRTWKRVP